MGREEAKMTAAWQTLAVALPLVFLVYAVIGAAIDLISDQLDRRKSK